MPGASRLRLCSVSPSSADLVAAPAHEPLRVLGGAREPRAGRSVGGGSFVGFSGRRGCRPHHPVLRSRRVLGCGRRRSHRGYPVTGRPRKVDGVVPGSLHIPRTVLEWRVAGDSPWRNLHLAGPDQRLILICDHGFSSILAARNLVELGFHRAGDVIGGFQSWRENDLPVARWRRRLSRVGALPGTGPPE